MNTPMIIPINTAATERANEPQSMFKLLPFDSIGMYMAPFMAINANDNVDEQVVIAMERGKSELNIKHQKFDIAPPGHVPTITNAIPIDGSKSKTYDRVNAVTGSIPYWHNNPEKQYAFSVSNKNISVYL